MVLYSGWSRVREVSVVFFSLRCVLNERIPFEKCQRDVNFLRAAAWDTCLFGFVFLLRYPASQNAMASLRLGTYGHR
jgi:hypothetical protein